jgi:hypothetical protein
LFYICDGHCFCLSQNASRKSMKVKYIPEEKIELHLKLGRKVAMFIKTDRFFESDTFDWISIEKQGDAYKSTLVRTINQGNALFTDVLSFETLNQAETHFDETTNPFVLGSLSDCFQWIKFKYGVRELTFVSLDDLKIIYTDLVTKGAFENK